MKISIAGAKLSHLVQKDRIWDHGSMAEQARIIFYLVHKAKKNGNIESLKKYCTMSCFEKMGTGIYDRQQGTLLNDPMIKELAVLEVHPGKNNKPDMFTAHIKGVAKADSTITGKETEFSSEWSFVRQGEWWMLNGMKLVTRQTILSAFTRILTAAC